MMLTEHGNYISDWSLYRCLKEETWRTHAGYVYVKPQYVTEQTSNDLDSAALKLLKWSMKREAEDL